MYIPFRLSELVLIVKFVCKSMVYFTECGRTLLGNSGWFNSPGWGSETQPTPERCEWRIVATHGERVVLNITGM